MRTPQHDQLATMHRGPAAARGLVGTQRLRTDRYQVPRAGERPGHDRELKLTGLHRRLLADDLAIGTQYLPGLAGGQVGQAHGLARRVLGWLSV